MFLGESEMIEIVFSKEARYVEFFENVKDIDGNLVLTPYYEFEYEGEKRRSFGHLCLQVKDVMNDEFEITLGIFIRDLIEKCKPTLWSKYLQQCINAIRWMDPVLSDFKRTLYGNGIEIEIQLGEIKDLEKWGSVNEAKGIKLSFRRLRSREYTLKTFIHELIHIVQFEEGYNMNDPMVEDEQFMLDVAQKYLSDTTIPELWRSLISK
jgi:hypothetical protein